MQKRGKRLLWTASRECSIRAPRNNLSDTSAINASVDELDTAALCCLVRCDGSVKLRDIAAEPGQRVAKERDGGAFGDGGILTGDVIEAPDVIEPFACGVGFLGQREGGVYRLDALTGSDASGC